MPDLMLPDANGLDVCRRLHQADIATPILMLTARDDPVDRVSGLEIGAADYLGSRSNRPNWRRASARWHGYRAM